MCTPPLCESARSWLQPNRLRQASLAILVVDAIYGLVLVVIHALLLGELGEAAAAQSATLAASAHRASGSYSSGRGVTTPVPNETLAIMEAEAAGSTVLNSWYLQLWDLDIAWAHELVGFDDFTCILFGLLYGVVTIVISAFVLNAVVHSAPTERTASRWFAAFAHLQIILYLVLILVKLRTLCSVQEIFLPLLRMTCEVLTYTYLEQCVIRLIFASLCVWIFSSYSYGLDHGGFMLEPQKNRGVQQVPIQDQRGNYQLVSRAQQMQRSMAVAGPATRVLEPSTRQQQQQFNLSSSMPRTGQGQMQSFSAANQFPRGNSSYSTSGMQPGIVPRSQSVSVQSGAGGFEGSIRPPLLHH